MDGLSWDVFKHLLTHSCLLVEKGAIDHSLVIDEPKVHAPFINLRRVSRKFRDAVDEACPLVPALRDLDHHLSTSFSSPHARILAQSLSERLMAHGQRLMNRDFCDSPVAGAICDVMETHMLLTEAQTLGADGGQHVYADITWHLPAGSALRWELQGFYAWDAREGDWSASLVLTVRLEGDPALAPTLGLPVDGSARPCFRLEMERGELDDEATFCAMPFFDALAESVPLLAGLEGSDVLHMALRFAGLDEHTELLRGKAEGAEGDLASALPEARRPPLLAERLRAFRQGAETTALWDEANGLLNELLARFATPEHQAAFLQAAQGRLTHHLSALRHAWRSSIGAAFFPPEDFRARVEELGSREFSLKYEEFSEYTAFYSHFRLVPPGATEATHLWSCARSGLCYGDDDNRMYTIWLQPPGARVTGTPRVVYRFHGPEHRKDDPVPADALVALADQFAPLLGHPPPGKALRRFLVMLENHGDYSRAVLPLQVHGLEDAEEEDAEEEGETIDREWEEPANPNPEEPFPYERLDTINPLEPAWVWECPLFRVPVRPSGRQLPGATRTL